jgi:hypothetical protein
MKYSNGSERKVGMSYSHNAFLNIAFACQVPVTPVIK